MTKIAVVTGADRGLGLAASAALARAGCTVIMTGRNAADVDVAAQSLLAQGLPAESQVLDVTACDSARCAAQAISNRHGQVDILVNNAGILPEATQTARVISCTRSRRRHDAHQRARSDDSDRGDAAAAASRRWPG